MYCRRRRRSWRYWARREASRIRRLRYIWGGEEGSEARGSASEVALAVSALMMGEVEGIVNSRPGGGAPFTSWSRLDILVFGWS